MTQHQRRGATIYSVAHAAGVSIATVSRVLQGSTGVSERLRKKVLDAVDALGYVPLGAARSLAVRHHEAHGLVLPELVDPGHAELLMGFESRAAELGQSVLVLLTDRERDVASASRKIATRVDGLAVLGSAGIQAEFAAALAGRKPVMVIAGDAGAGVEAVGADNVRGARELTEHLFGHGRGRLHFVGDPEVARDIRDRYQGFAEAHRDRRAVAAEPVRIPVQEAHGARFADELLAGTVGADALVCANDELALSIMAGLQRGGCTVPDDIAVVGWGDVLMGGNVHPGLTSVRLPARELGELAATRLHELVNGATPVQGTQVIPTAMVLRASCGCPWPARGTPAPAHKLSPRPCTESENSHETHSSHDGCRPHDGRAGPVRVRS